MDIQEEKDTIKRNIKWETPRSENPGGQSCGIMGRSVTLVSEELDLKIHVGFHRGQLANRNLVMTLFELALDDLVK